MSQPSPFDAPGGPSAESHPTRWRIIPAALLMIFGLLISLGGLVSIVATLFIRLPPAPPRVVFVLSAALWTGMGALWMLSGRLFWQRKWLTAVLVGLIGWALGAVIARAIEP